VEDEQKRAAKVEAMNAELEEVSLEIEKTEIEATKGKILFNGRVRILII
jgi:hypothetical protein